MKIEFDALISNNIWTLVPRPINRKVTSSKWVYRVKKFSPIIINKLKSCVIAKGQDQIVGFDFVKTFNLVIKFATVSVILTLTLNFHQTLKQIDVNNAFLNDILDKKVYMEKPLIIEDSFFLIMYPS